MERIDFRPRSQRKPHRAPPKPNILLVDDNRDNLRILASILGSCGYRVRKAVSGTMALETIAAERPELVLLDIKMPDMSGYEVCAKVKANPDWQDLPIIFLSALDSVADKVRAFEVGGADYITKPFQAEEVLVRVSHQLTIQRQRQALNAQNDALQQAQAELQLLLSVIHAVNHAETLPAALQAVLAQVGEKIDWHYGEVWIWDEAHQGLRIGQSWYDLTDSPLAQFYQHNAVLATEADIGIIAQVWSGRQAQWLELLTTEVEALGLRTASAIAAGLQTVLVVPIPVNGQVVAVLAFYNRRAIPYEAKTLALVSAIALQLGGLIERKQAEEALRLANQELQRQANLDGLTLVGNRRCFDEALAQEWRRLSREESPLSLLMCDIDAFKPYNDCYGHLAGDRCLKQIAATLQQVCKRPADLVARYGGEEFVVLLPHVDEHGAQQVAEAIQRAIAQLAIPHALSPVGSTITLSIGVASSIPRPDLSPESLIAAADQALYAAKDRGRNTYAVASDL